MARIANFDISRSVSVKSLISRVRRVVTFSQERALTETRKNCFSSPLDTQEAFVARMEAQCQAIEKYRVQTMQDEGRQLSLDEAAKEWIDLYADSFARNNDIT